MSYYTWNWSKSLCAVGVVGGAVGVVGGAVVRWFKPIIVFSLVQSEQLVKQIS